MKNKLPKFTNPDLQDSVVLVTGAGGTIGSNLVMRLQAKLIIAVDISEYAIYKLQRQLNGTNVHCMVGDVSDPKLVRMIFDKYKIDYVFNAAAYKHVDTLEDENNTYSVVKNNILSVVNLCNHAREVKCLVHVSSDKAVNPTNSMGYTKLWCERIIQLYSNINKNTKHKIVRFGNVYKSSGSFVETIEWQLANNLPITITDDRMKRYFMSVDDAVSLISKVPTVDGENATYILEMGEEVSIVDLVDKLNVNNQPIEYIGIRAGEKLQEELIYPYETLEPTQDPMIHRVEWTQIGMVSNLGKLLNELHKDKICLETLNKIITTTTIL